MLNGYMQIYGPNLRVKSGACHIDRQDIGLKKIINFMLFFQIIIDSNLPLEFYL